MSDEFSTAATVQAKADALRIQTGVIDYTVIDSAAAEAKADILAYLKPRYGSVCDDWDSDTRPDYVGAISDWLTLYNLLTGNNAEHPVAIRRHDESITRLEKIAGYELMLPGVDFTTGQTNETTRAQYLDCTQSEIDAGDCDPCSYEYV